jgi:hypothetical protein
MLACLCVPQFELSWILTNQASHTSKQCQHVVDRGGIALFMQHLQSDDFDVADQAVQGVSQRAAVSRRR